MDVRRRLERHLQWQQAHSCFLQGGDEEQISHGAAMALKNLLGLVCDPVAGLVEVPCVKRNVIGAVNALSSADMHWRELPAGFRRIR